MRDVRQPCLASWEKGGIDGVACEAPCPEFKSNISDVDGAPDTCPIQLFVWLMEKAGIGKRERKLLLSDAKRAPRLDETEPLRVVREWLANPNHETMLVLAGTKGVGKTVAACYALSRLLRRHSIGRYILATDIVDPDVKVRRFANYPVLVIDQMGLEYVSTPEWGESRFTELLVRRDSDMLPTILVGNITEDGFRTRYKSLVADRLDGDGVFRFFKSPSLRGQPT